MNRLFVAAAAALACSLAQAGPTLLINGNFEADVLDVSNGGYTKVAAGQTTILGWTVGGTSVDLIRNNYGAITNVSVDLAGTPGPGTLSQSFAVVAGETYELAFDYYRNGAGTSLTVGFGDLAPIVLGAPGAVTHKTYTWTAATTGLASVSFASGAGNSGPTLDNVSVTSLTAVPEPQSAALALLALAAGSLATRRRAR